jgi:hypothetical protein
MKTVLLHLWLGFFAVSPLLAQKDATSEPRQAKGRVAWFIYTSMPEGLENPVSVMTGKDLIQLTLSKRSPSEPVKIPADGILRVVRKVANPDDPAKPNYLTLAQAIIPDGVGKALIILAPVAKPDSALVFQAKVQDLAAFTGGDYLYLNLTTLNIAVEMGTTKIGLKPGETKIYDAPELTESTNVPVRYSFFHPTQQQWQVLSASTVVLRSTRREICIFSWDPRFGRVDYHGITFPVTP